MTRARITRRDRERYLAERATIPARALAYRTVGPRYLERAVEQFGNNSCSAPRAIP